MKFIWVVVIILTLVVIYTLGHYFYQTKLEQPSYEVLLKTAEYEVRRYPSLHLAEVDVAYADEFRDALNQGFQAVAGYIFGGNSNAEGVAAKIAMTAPVLYEQQPEAKNRQVSFVLPQEWNLENLPTPNNEKVNIYKTNPRIVAVKTVRGVGSQKKLEKAAAELRLALTKNDIEYQQETTYAFYDPPSAPWFIRKNEVLVELKVSVDSDLTDQSIPDDAASVILAGGCFWCIEAAFDQLEGIYAAISGYTGGDEANANYYKVASGQTEHREAVQIFYDPKLISYRDILEIFWRQIDPRDPGGQFADRGQQYTTAIYYANEEEQETAEASKADLDASGKFNAPIVTEILPAEEFYNAEAKHQNFAQKQAAFYQRYKYGSGRGEFIEQNWEK